MIRSAAPLREYRSFRARVHALRALAMPVGKSVYNIASIDGAHAIVLRKYAPDQRSKAILRCSTLLRDRSRARSDERERGQRKRRSGEYSRFRRGYVSGSRANRARFYYFVFINKYRGLSERRYVFHASTVVMACRSRVVKLRLPRARARVKVTV